MGSVRTCSRRVCVMYLIWSIFCVCVFGQGSTFPAATTQAPVSGTAQLTSETTAVAEPELTSQSVSESTSEPESEVTSEPESESTSEPESEVSSQPESESTSEPESEVTSQPESESTSEPESEATPQPESESTSEPESEVTSQPESESTSEPESEVTSQLVSEGISEPESNVTSQPESEATSEPESEVTSQPESESSSEPESEVTSQPESESSSEPESEVTSQPESESSSEPESEVTSQPESEGTSEPESDVTSEPLSEGISEPVSEATSEPESEVTSEPESEVTSEPESEVTSEPESEGTSEPESVVTSEPESEVTSEPESEGTSEPKAEVLAEPESAVTSEPISEQTSEPESEASAKPESGAAADAEVMGVPEQRPSAVEIVGPPVILISAIIIALLVLLLRSRRASINNTVHGVSKTFLDSIITKKKVNCVSPTHEQLKVIDLTSGETETLKLAVPVKEPDQPLFSYFDLEVLQSLRNCYNQPKELVRIAMPAIFSLALCPLTLYMFDPFRRFVWPEAQYSNSRPDINDAIACYLSPAGLVYATSFGFAFQQVLNKQHEILTKMTEEISMLDQIVTFTIKLNLSLQTKMKILQAVKTECIFMVLQVLNRDTETYKCSPTEDVKVKIWTVVDLLREVDTSRKNHVDRFLSERILSHIMKLNSICSDKMGILHTKIHPFKWVFLETLGFFSFLGILLLTAHSYRMELIMCIVTVFSISMLCYVVSDLDSPFSGFFRVDIGVLEEVLQRLELAYDMAKHNGHMDVFYPE
ncbi:mucin-5AC-like [Littorina saxatilis]|uniref:mucin-5AC-like n=1 Tax=Littorina saxatilis TaxID=31220 RepID=UPI0038B66F26